MNIFNPKKEKKNTDSSRKRKSKRSKYIIKNTKISKNFTLKRKNNTNKN